MRAQLLGGRGPGADAAEVAEHTRSRSHLAGVPLVELLDRVQQQTLEARGAGTRRSFPPAEQRRPDGGPAPPGEVRSTGAFVAGLIAGWLVGRRR